MAESPTNHTADPSLLSPRREAIVDATSVPLSWEPVEEAEEYVVQIARDSRFEHIVYEQNVGDTTSAVVEDAFPADESSYFWRIRARSASGWSEGERIEMFVAGTPKEAASGLHRPDDDETLGPMTELVRASHIEMAADVTKSEKYFQREREMGVAHEGVEAKQILSIIVATVLTVSVLVVSLIAATDVTQRNMIYTVSGESQYPELRETERQASELLDSYAMVNDANGVYRIPIDRAMEQMAIETREGQDDISKEWAQVMGR